MFLAGNDHAETPTFVVLPFYVHYIICSNAVLMFGFEAVTLCFSCVLVVSLSASILRFLNKTCPDKSVRLLFDTQ